MLKNFKIVVGILVLGFSTLAFSQCSTQDPWGSDPPTQVRVNGACLIPNSNINVSSWYGGTPGQVQLCDNTVNASDISVSVNYNVNQSYSGPTAHRIVYSNANQVGTKCVIVDKLMNHKTYAIVVNTCKQGGTGGKWGMNCSRFSSSNSSAGYPANQHHGFLFTTPTANSSNPLVWNFYPDGAPEVFQGKNLNLDLIGVWSDGPQPAAIFLTSLQIDGLNCGANNRLGASCTSAMKSLLHAGGGEIPNNGALGYNVSVYSGSNQFNGDFYVPGNAVPTVLNQPGAMQLLMTSSTTPVGQHTFKGVYQAVNSSMQPIGAPVTVVFNFNVLAALPAFTPVPPTVFPVVTGLSKWNTTIATTMVQDFIGVKNSELNVPGQYANDNMSGAQLSNNPTSFINYGGAARIPFQFGDYFGAVTTGWQPNHFYNVGDMYCSAGSSGCNADPTCVMVVTRAGTSGSTQPTCPSWGVAKLDGGAIESSVGNVSTWNLVAQRGGTQVIDWATTMPWYSTWMEWNAVTTWDISDYYWRQNNQLSENCNGQTTCIGLPKKAIAYFLNPLVKTSGIQVNSPIWSYAVIQADTNRSQPYTLEFCSAYMMITGQKVLNSGVDECQSRVNLQEQYLARKVNYNPVESSSNPFPGSLQAPNFDDGLGTESMIHYCVAQQVTNGTCDSTIPYYVKKWADWYYLNEYQTSSHNTSYTPWLVPGVATANDLNMLNGVTYAWVGSFTNNGTIPGTNVTYFQAADDMAYHSLDSGFYGYKDAMQVFKSFTDYIGWRTGRYNALQTSVMPSLNRPVPLFPEKMEPYNSASWPSGFPKATNITSSGATITFYSMKASSSIVKIAKTNTNGSCPATFTASFTGSLGIFAGHDNQWIHTVQVSGLLPNTKYCYGMGGTDGAGNTGFSSYNPANPPYAFVFTTTASPLGQVGNMVKKVGSVVKSAF